MRRTPGGSNQPPIKKYMLCFSIHGRKPPSAHFVEIRAASKIDPHLRDGPLGSNRPPIEKQMLYSFYSQAKTPEHPFSARSEQVETPRSQIINNVFTQQTF